MITTEFYSHLNPKKSNYLRYFLLDFLNGTKHWSALMIYLFIVVGHFSEHLIQMLQIHLLGWSTRAAGGILGLWFPALAASEVLHMVYNSLQLTGLILLCYGFRKYKWALNWWKIALVAQSWHWFEHLLLQIQYFTGNYLFNASHQTSLLEMFFPRVGLHFAYNLLTFVPTMIAICCYWWANNSLKDSKRSLSKPLNTLLTHIESSTSVSLFLSNFEESVSKPLSIFMTHVERSLSLKEHMRLIQGILTKSLGIGVLSLTLIFMIIGVYGLIW